MGSTLELLAWLFLAIGTLNLLVTPLLGGKTPTGERLKGALTGAGFLLASLIIFGILDYYN